MPESELIECGATGGFADWLAGANGTVALTAHQVGRVVLADWDGTQVSVLMRDYPRPMGLAVDGSRLWLATRDEVVALWNAPTLAAGFLPERAGGYQALYLPRLRYSTGQLDAHELAVGHDGLWIVATRYNCLAQLSERYSFEPTWRPPFITEDGPADRCHINGLAMIDGKPAYATALGATSQPGAWRANRAVGGVLLAIADGSVRLGGLCTPHSPRWHNGQLWLLNSGLGELWRVDPASGRHDVVCALPGYLRGLAFAGPHALVGMCQIREHHLFAGLPVQERFKQLKCGVAVVDLRTGTSLGSLEFTSGCRELFSVTWLPGIHRAMLLNPDHPAQQEAVTTPSFNGWLRRAEPAGPPAGTERP